MKNTIYLLAFGIVFLFVLSILEGNKRHETLVDIIEMQAIDQAILKVLEAQATEINQLRDFITIDTSTYYYECEPSDFVFEEYEDLIYQ